MTANKFGLEMIKQAKISESLTKKARHIIITLSLDSDTLMYDSVRKVEFEELRIPLFVVSDINKSTGLIRYLNPDTIIMCGWRQIVSEEILKIPKDYFIGFHPTLLPKGRGSAPIIHTIMNGDSESGVTMYHVDKGLDTGDIIGQEKFYIYDNDTAEKVYEKVIFTGKSLIRNYWIPILSETLPRIPQDNSKATIFEELPKDFNRLDLNQPIKNIYRKIRALSKPYLGAYIEKGDKKLIIWKADVI